jgi:hypothetical protein
MGLAEAGKIQIIKNEKHWTPAEEESLERLRDAGCTWETILKAIPGRTRGAMQHRYGKLVRKIMPRM